MPSKPGQIALIYVLTNTVNGKRYVGFTTDLKKRLWKHKSVAKGDENQWALYSAIRKHGWEAFQCEVVACSKDVEYAQNVLEGWFIKQLQTYSNTGHGYNMTFGGEGALGTIKSPEARAISSRCQKGRVRSEQERLNHLQGVRRGKDHPFFGKTHSGEIRERMIQGRRSCVRRKPVWSAESRLEVSLRFKGKPIPAERVARVAAAHRGKPGRLWTEEQKRRRSEMIMGHEVTPETLRKIILSRAEKVVYFRSADGKIYETASVSALATAFGKPQGLAETVRTGRIVKKGFFKDWCCVKTEPLTDSKRAEYTAMGETAPLYKEISLDSMPSII